MDIKYTNIFGNMIISQTKKISNEKTPNKKTPKIEIPNEKTPNVLKNAERPEKRRTVCDERTELLPLVRLG
jgi:hypothetical protein